MGAVYSLLKIISNEEKKKLLQNQLKISKWCTCRTWFWCAVFHYFSIWLCMSFLHDQVYFSLLMLQWLFLALFILLLLFFSRVQLFVTPWTASHQASLSITNSQSLLKLMSTESVMPSKHLILCCPLFLLPSIFPSIRVFSNELTLSIRKPKY